MNKKQKFRIVVIVPVLATVIIAGMAIYFVLQLGASGGGHTGVVYTPDMAVVADPALTIASSEAGNSGDEQPALTESECNYNEWVGKPVDEDTIKAAGRPYRILGPNAMATRDFRPDRINVMTDDSNIVIAVRCG